MSYQEIMEECWKEMHRKEQEALLRQIEYHQWYRKTFNKILSEKGCVTPEDMEQAFIHDKDFIHDKEK